MTEIVQKNYADNESLTLERLKNKENFMGIIRAIHSQANDLETAIFEIRDNFWLNSNGFEPVSENPFQVGDDGDYMAGDDGDFMIGET